MATLQTLRLFVNERLTAAVDDIFRVFSVTIKEYEEQVYRLKHVIDGRAAGLPIACSEEEQQASGRSLSLYPHIKQEEGGASGAQETCIKFTQCPDWLTEMSEDDCTSLSNQIRACSAERPPELQRAASNVWNGKLEAEEPQPSHQEPVDLQNYTTEEERQQHERSLILDQEHQRLKQEEGGTSGHQETDTNVTPTPSWLGVRSKDEESQSQNRVQTSLIGKGSPSSNQVQTHIREELLSDLSALPVTSKPAVRIIVRPVHRTDSSLAQAGESLRFDSCTDYSRTAEGGDAPKQLPRTHRCEDGLRGDHAETTQRIQKQSSVGEKFSCTSCGQAFHTEGLLKKHLIHSPTQNHHHMTCSAQGKLSRTPTKSFRCKVCEGYFYTQGLLVRHAENHCKELECRCGACGETLESTESLRTHLRSHKEIGSTCNFCGKKCGSIKRMEIHKRIHTGEKPYSCTFCGRDFNRKESLERHAKVHSGERPYSCTVCQRTFTRRDYLVSHLKNHTESHGRAAGTAGADPFIPMF